MFKTRLVQIALGLVVVACLSLLVSGAVKRSAPAPAVTDDVDAKTLVDSMAKLDCADHLPKGSSNPRIQAARDVCVGYGH